MLNLYRKKEEQTEVYQNIKGLKRQSHEKDRADFKIM